MPLSGSAGVAVPRDPAGVRGAGGLLCERSGIINIAIEGQLLGGAFLASVVATLTGSAYAGLIAAPVAGALVGLLLVLFSIKYVVNQIIVGVVLNVLVIGVTSYLFSTVLKENPDTWNNRPGLPSSASRCSRRSRSSGRCCSGRRRSSTSCTSS